MGKLEIEVSGSIGWLYIDNETRRNAIDVKIMNDFKRVLNELEVNDEVKVIVITGKGSKSFCSGGDLSVFHQLHTETESYDMLSKMAENLFYLFTFSKPTIALLNGSAVGGGCEIAAACDFRVAIQDIRCGFIQGTLGITTGWGGSTFLLERIPQANALYLLTSGEIISAEDAKNIGFIQQVFTRKSWNEQFDNWLNSLLQKSLPVLHAYKSRLLDSYDLDLISERVEKEVRQCARLWESDEHHEHVKSFLTRK